MAISRILAFVVSFLLCIALAEFGLRTVARRPLSEASASQFNAYVSDSLLGYRLKRGWRGTHRHADFEVTVRTNGLGMRGGPATREKAQGVYRILLIGDSYAFGFGVEEAESFPQRLASRFPSLEFLNASVPGYAGDHYSLYLRERGFDLAPDLVIVTYYENDVSDLGWSELELGPDRVPTRTQSRLRMIDHRGRMRYVNKSGLDLPGWLVEPPARLQSRSHLFNWLRLRIARLWVASARESADARRAAAAGSPPEGAIESLTGDEVLRGLVSGDDFRARYHGFVMSQLEEAARDAGIALRMVNLPSVAGRLQADCLARIHCLDLSTLFTREQEPELFLPTDGHWTADGHRITADAIARWLEADVALGLAGLPSR